MKNLKIMLLVFLLTITFLPKAQTKTDLIKWSSQRRLQWKDYLARPDNLSSAAASTNTLISFEYQIQGNVFTYTISCSFSKTKSWGRYKTDYILSHEQGHFDIAEIFTRKLSKAMQEYTFNPSSYKKDLQKIYSQIMKEKEEFQQQYDAETDYSRIDEKQKEWLIKIEKELSRLEKYANY